MFFKLDKPLKNTHSTYEPHLYEQRYKWMYFLKLSDDSVVGLSRLRDLLLVEFADQLRDSVVDTQAVKHLRWGPLQQF